MAHSQRSRRDLVVRGLFVVATLGALALLAFDVVDLRVTIGALTVIGAAYLLLLSRQSRAMLRSHQELAISSQSIAKMTSQALDLSNNILTELRVTREAQTTPYVVVSLEVRDTTVQLVMENLGQSLAREIALEWDPMPANDLIGGRAWAAFVTTVTPTLAPRQRLVAVLGSYDAVFANPARLASYRVTVRYRGLSDTIQYQGTDILDFNSLAGMEFPMVRQGEALLGRMDQIAQSLAGALRQLQQSHSQIVNQLGDLGHTFETTIAATNSTQAQVVNSLADISRTVAGTMAATNATQSQVIATLEDISKVVVETLESANIAHDHLVQGIARVGTNQREVGALENAMPDEPRTPEDTVLAFKTLVQRLNLNWHKWQEWRAEGQPAPATFVQRSMRHWADEIAALAEGLPAAPVVVERTHNIAQRMLTVLDVPATEAAAVDMHGIIEELGEIARTFPDDEESFLL
jgi:hypothetical protein